MWGDEVQFEAPGVCHHARWLLEAFYCLKMYFFYKQLKVSVRDTDTLRQICVFIILFYVKILFIAPNAIKDPNSDLKLVKDLLSHRKFYPEIAIQYLENYLNIYGSCMNNLLAWRSLIIRYYQKKNWKLLSNLIVL